MTLEDLKKYVKPTSHVSVQASATKDKISKYPLQGGDPTEDPEDPELLVHQAREILMRVNDESLSAEAALQQLNQLLRIDELKGSQNEEDSTTSSKSRCSSSRHPEQLDCGVSPTRSLPTVTRRKRSSRRRTMARVGASNLLKKDDSASFSLAPTRSSSDPSFSPSVSPTTSFTEKGINRSRSFLSPELITQHDLTHDVQVQEKLEVPDRNFENDIGKWTKASVEPANRDAESAEVGPKQSKRSRSAGTKLIRRSQRRRTLAFHDGLSLLPNCTTPSSLSSMTPPSESTATSTASFAGSSHGNARTPKRIELLTTDPSKKKRDTSVKHTERSFPKPRKRPKRNSLLPGKLRDSDLIVGYTPKHTDFSVGSGLIERIPRKNTEVISPRGESKMINDSKMEVYEYGSKRETYEESPIARGPEPGLENEKEVIGWSRAVLSSKCSESKTQRKASMGDKESLPPSKKNLKKRRSSIGMNCHGSLVSSSDFVNVMEETLLFASKKSKRQSFLPSNTANCSVDSPATGSNEDAVAQNVKGVHTREESLSYCSLHEATVHGKENMHNAITVEAEGTPFKIVGLGVKSLSSENGQGPETRTVQHQHTAPTTLYNIVESLSCESICDTMLELSPDDCDIRATTCMSVRLFSVFKLCVDNVQDLEPLFRVLVGVELESLRVSTDASPKRKEVVHFCGIDGSSTQPPVDSVPGSHASLDRNIHALKRAAQEIQRLCNTNNCLTTKEHLISLNHFLDRLCDTQIDFGRKICEVCSKSMPVEDWPPTRFASAASLYREDFNCIVAFLDQKAPISCAHRYLNLHKRLADFLGRAIRFYLRKFFNPVPLALTTGQPVDSAVRSRVHEILIMEEDGGDRDTAAADGSISSVFCLALRNIYDYFGTQNVWSQSFLPATMTSFFKSSASNKGVGTKRVSIVIKDDALEDVLKEINQAHRFLAAANACKFIRQLLSWSGVKAEIDKVGGWRGVECYGRMMTDFHLEMAFPDDGHLALLKDVDVLCTKMKKFWEVMAPAVKTCDEELSSLWSRFRCGTESKAVLSRNPHIKTIRNMITDAKRKSSFPSLTWATDQNEET